MPRGAKPKDYDLGVVGRVRWLYEEGLTQDEVASVLGISQKVVWNLMRRAGIAARAAIKRDQRGHFNARWKGGAIRMGNGYRYVRDPSHPKATKSGYVAEHIKVATAARGAPLEKGECVHHINMRKRDNRAENLVITDRSTHAKWHRELEVLVGALFNAGILDFDTRQGYFLPGGDA